MRLDEQHDVIENPKVIQIERLAPEELPQIKIQIKLTAKSRSLDPQRQMPPFRANQ